jgi:hypothetical protein
MFTGPAIVLSSTRVDLAELGSLWTDEHRRWALRSPRRTYIRVDSVGHQIHRERPRVVIEAVQHLIAMPDVRQQLYSRKAPSNPALQTDSGAIDGALRALLFDAAAAERKR